MIAQDEINLRNEFSVISSLFKAKYGVSLILSYDEDSSSVSSPAPKPSMSDVLEACAKASETALLKTSSADRYVMAMAPNLKYDKEKGIIGSVFSLRGKRNNYIVTEINQRAPKYCVHIEVQGSGARYKMPLTSLFSATYVGHI